jgi:hypothetical protein
MAINLAKERPVSIKLARQTLFPQPNGSPISPATSYRWIGKGILAKDGQRVRLEAVRLGRELVTTEAAVQRFLDELVRRSGVEPSRDNELSPSLAGELAAAGLLEST